MKTGSAPVELAGAVLWAAVALLTACAPRPDLQRFIEEDPTGVLDLRQLGEAQAVFDWRFDDAADLDSWGVRGGRLVGSRGSGLEIAIDEGKSHFRLQRQVMLDARGVGEIVLTVASDRACRPVVLWGGEGESVGPRRRELGVRLAEQGNRRTYGFRVSENPVWRGSIRFLRFYLCSGNRRSIELIQVSGYRRAGRAEALQEAATSPWKVDLGEDRRGALVTPPGAKIVREATISRGSTLQLALGSMSWVTRPDSGDDPTAPAATAVHRLSIIPAGGDTVRVLEEAVGPAETWHHRTIDLSPFAGRGRARFVFEAVAPVSGVPVVGLPVWANPAVVPAPRRDRPPNVVLVSLDTLRADRMSLNGYHRPTTPEIDAWARSGVNFPNTVASATWTLPSHASMFTGLDALSHGVDRGAVVRPELTLLAERLRSRGWATLAITAGGQMRPRSGFDQGFDRYTYRRSRKGGDSSTELEDNLEAALAAIEAHRERPLFLFFHTYEIHAPYRPRQPFLTRLTGRSGVREDYEIAPSPITDLHPRDGALTVKVLRRRPWGGGPEVPLDPAEMETVGDLYDAGIAYADAALGRLLRRLGDADLAERTLVVLTSDHGEALGGDGLVGHGLLPEHQAMVPLVISFPGRVPAGKTIGHQVRSIDILPTVLELLELPAAKEIDGVSLVPLMRGERATAPPPAWIYAVRQGAAVRVSNRWRYEFYDHPWPPAFGQSRLLDLHAGGPSGSSPGSRAPDPEVLRRKMIDRLETVPGLGLSFSNSTPRALRVRLHSKLLQPKALRATEACGCAEWRPAEPAGGSLHITVGAERAHRFLITPVRDSPLIIEAALDGQKHAGIRREVDAANLVSPVGWSFAGDGWEEWDPRQPRPATGIVFEWQGDSTLRGVPAEPPDPEVQDELRALGYLQ